MPPQLDAVGLLHTLRTISDEDLLDQYELMHMFGSDEQNFDDVKKLLRAELMGRLTARHPLEQRVHSLLVYVREERG